MIRFLSLIKIGILQSLAYRAHIFLELAKGIVIVVAYYYFWNAVFENSEKLATYNLPEMITYLCISRIIHSMFIIRLDLHVYERIYSGLIAVDLLRPIGFIKLIFFQGFGKIIVNFLLVSIPILFVSIFFFEISLPNSLLSIMLFFVSASLSLVISFYISILFGLLGFWLIEIGWFLWAKEFVINFFSGIIIPISFFPSWLETITFTLPFHTMVHIPLQIYLERLSKNEIINAFGIQLFWIVFMHIFIFSIINNAYKRLEVQGG